MKACKALLNMKRSLPNKQARYQNDRTTRTVDRYKNADVESSSNFDDSQVEHASEYDRLESINKAQALQLPQALPIPHALPSTAGAMNTIFVSRRSAYTRPAHVTCSGGSVCSEESRQRSCSPLTSDASEDMNVPTPIRSINTGNGNSSPFEMPRNQMVLVKAAPEPLPYNRRIPLRASPPPPRLHPMPTAPVLWRPVKIPAALHPINAKLAQVPTFRDFNRYIVVRARNYERMSNAVLQQALQEIQAPVNLRTKPKALQYLKSYFLAVRDRSHVIYVEKYKPVLVSS
jgi:hypothetical protein